MATSCSLNIGIGMNYSQPIRYNYVRVMSIETSLLRRLQAQTLPDEAPPIGKIHPFSKMAITFEPLMGF